ncbi:4179_t:CDS:1 [Funneliformis geosporum]|uniref:5470_t:CDS:1 n=1 Tax=Funneliformis geosporum TaxID=1117311 RepID=A0A9W4WV48_9GLOM|nr:5470_t:CDS:1 [Funneliformis geosporum]CAI2176604.1 4179_t:CDS:1 [Funneliformis geosporum]
MVAYYYPYYEPRISPFYTRRFFQPTQNSFPCSYQHYNTSPLYNHPEPYYHYTPQNYSVYDDEEKRLKQKEQLKRFNEHNASKYSTNHEPGKSFKIKINGGEEEEAKSRIDKSQAALKIFNFTKHQTEKKRLCQTLEKLHELRKIEDELKEIHRSKHIGTLTFDKEHEIQVLPISIENKRFLEYEDKITKLLDKLDRVQSVGAHIIRDRRKLDVKFAQTLLEELDKERENQWKSFGENLQVFMNDADENSVANENSEIVAPVKEESVIAPPNEVANDASDPMDILPER